MARQRYRVFILPGMRAIRFEAYRRLTEFLCAGGEVIVLGQLPAESDRAGRIRGKARSAR